METKKKAKETKKNVKVIEGQPDRIVCSESVRVNIGDYEHKEFFVSLASDFGEGETFDEAYARVATQVSRKVRAREKKCRHKSREFVDFDTKAKL